MGERSAIASWLWKTISPVFLVLGTVGNLLSIVVLTRPGTRKSSTAIYLTALAITDLTVLYTGFLRWWMIYTFDLDIRLFNDVGCRFHWFSTFVAPEISSWLLVAVTCERIACTIWPHRVRLVCTRRSARFTVFAIVLVLCGGSCHLIFGTSLRTAEIEPSLISLENMTTSGTLIGNNQSTRTTTDLYSANESERNTTDTHAVEYKFICDAFSDEMYRSFFSFVYPWIDLLLYFFIPSVILSVGEVLILRKVMESRRLRIRMSQKSNACVEITANSRSIIIMLLTVNAVFIICTTPISVFLIGRPYWVNSETGLTEHQEIVWAVVNLLMYLNHTINFILYFLSGSRFREKVYELFKKKRPDSSFSQDAVSDNGQQGQTTENPSVPSGVSRPNPNVSLQTDSSNISLESINSC
ncbi:FMRFamide receptor-like [Mercenaria mercenaria]|uniref:FMRFamide receptor-like n=1 Tax=Mercenaria mercenaria TaxID=6596 RepID=UPI00234F1BAF|nr:FMRFamide receptor-like [Mercenaria mercenaria]